MFRVTQKPWGITQQSKLILQKILENNVKKKTEVNALTVREIKKCKV